MKHFVDSSSTLLFIQGVANAGHCFLGPDPAGHTAARVAGAVMHVRPWTVPWPSAQEVVSK